jgi:hypothetical protein
MDPFFKIEQAPIWTLDNFGDRYEVPNRMAIINDSNAAILGIVSKNYIPVMNKDVYDLFLEALKHLEIKKEIHHLDKDGRKWFCDFVISGNQTEFDITGTGDIVGILIRAFNAYDGKSTFGYEIMGYRYLCSNGQIFGKRSLFSKGFRHFIGKAEKLMEDFSLQFRLFESNAELWGQWSTTEYWTDDFTKFLADKKYVGEKLSKYLIDEHVHKHCITKWDVYNIFTRIATHETQGRNNVSGVFTNKYKILTRLIEDFYRGE